MEVVVLYKIRNKHSTTSSSNNSSTTNANSTSSAQFQLQNDDCIIDLILTN